MFPAGWPGIALLLLRVAVAMTAIVDVCSPDPYRWSWLLLVLGLVGLTLAVGIFTPVFALFSLIVQFARFALIGDHPIERLVGILIAFALIFLGPGAYSVDARRFGRRRLTFPPKKPTDS
jgi:putative oxidoreductase